MQFGTRASPNVSMRVSWHVRLSYDIGKDTFMVGYEFVVLGGMNVLVYFDFRISSFFAQSWKVVWIRIGVWDIFHHILDLARAESLLQVFNFPQEDTVNRQVLNKSSKRFPSKLPCL